VTIVAFCALILFLATGVALFLKLKGLDAASDIAQLLSLPLAAVPLVVPIVKWWRRTREPPIATAEDVARAKEQLISLLGSQWRAESQLRALDDPDPIPVLWRLTGREELVDIPSNRTVDVLTVASSEDVRTLVAEFRQLRRRRLVILGDAGAGKTTLAVQILLELLRPGARDASEPVPVLLSLTGWEPAHQPLRAWLADRIIHEYPALGGAGLGPHVVRALTEQNQVLAVLDGLDEMPEAAQEVVLEAINKAMDGDTQLILTSRTEAYTAAVEAAGRVLNSAVVIEPERITAAAAADYLQRCLPPAPSPAWRSILQRLRSDPDRDDPISALADVASSPLGLWLIRMAYISTPTDPSPLLDTERFPGPGEVRSHLFDQLIWACIKARTPSENPSDLFRPRNEYEAEDVQRWLRFLAANLDHWGTRDFDWTTDPRALARPVRWPVVLGAFLGRAAPMVARVARSIGADRRAVALCVAAAIAAFVLVTSAAARTDQGLRSIGYDGLAQTIGPLWFLAIIVVIGAAWWTTVMAWKHTDPDTLAVAWTDMLVEQRLLVRRGLTIAAQVVSFAVTYAVLVGVIAGALTALASNVGVGRWVGLVTGGAAGVLAGLYFLTDLNRPPGGGLRLPWYGVGPWRGLRGAISASAGIGLVIAFVFGILYGRLYPDRHVNAFQAAVIAYFPVVALLCLVLIPLHVLVTPVIFTLSSAIMAPVRLLILRPPVPAPHKRMDSLELWRLERRGQQTRLLNVAVVTVLFALAAVGLCLVVRGTSDWSDIHRGGFALWLGSQTHDFVVSWSGYLRYAFAVLIAWMVTIPSSGHRGWIRWLVGIVVAVLIVAFWPGVGRPDAFDLRLTADVERLVGHFQLSAGVRLVRIDETFTGSQTVDFDAILANGGFRTLALVVVLVLGLIVFASVFGLLEASESRAWWSTKVATLWHSFRGRLPKDLLVFLDDAHRLGLLRSVGTAYQFRHAEFQDHLARSTSVNTREVPVPRSPIDEASNSDQGRKGAIEDQLTRIQP
jgi:hypothetical protein